MTATDDPLVSTDWLAAHIDDGGVKIIDASFKLPGVLPLPVDDYLAAHIPGAVFFDVDAISDHDDPRPHMFPDASQLARDISALGISTGDTVVAYDSGGWVAAPAVKRVIARMAPLFGVKPLDETPDIHRAITIDTPCAGKKIAVN